MSQGTIDSPRFRLVFTWGGVVIALLGFVFLATGDSPTGLLLLAAGMIAWLFAKRRSRAAQKNQ